MPRYSTLLNQIKSNVFIICPNNSGSTFLKNVLATCKQTWNLKAEGQNTFGFSGPNRYNKTKPYAPLLWASKESLIQYFINPELYNWEESKRAWYLQAFSRSPNTATIFIEKSPPFLLNVPALNQYFNNAKFIFMVRNPYAVIASIAKRNCLKKYMPEKNIDLTHLATQHIINCFHYQRENIERYNHNGIFIKYESMCNKHLETEIKIKKLVPELDDLNLHQKIAVKGIYNETLRNMNEQQINTLTEQQLETISNLLIHEEDILHYFDYQLL